MTAKTETPNPHKQIEIDAAERFAADVADHQMTVLHDDGLYRHLKYARPGRSLYWFEIVTWPGALAIRGDHGAHVFARTDDMFTFFRRRDGGINPGYWAEKLPDHGKSVQTYSEDVLRAELEPYLTEYAERYPGRLAEYETRRTAYGALPWEKRWPRGKFKEPVKPKAPDEIRELVDDFDADGELSDEDGARVLLRRLERAGVVSDTWEWSLTAWDYHYLWCCHAIAWGIAQYDAAKAPAVQTVEVAGVTR